MGSAAGTYQTTISGVRYLEPKYYAESDLLERGSHIYLFAIQLPSSVNYPPTIRDSYLGHRIEYTLQGHLDFTLDNSTHKHKSTASVPLTYLPLVTFDDRMNQYATRNKSIKIEQGDEYVHVTASLANPSSCPDILIYQYHQALLTNISNGRS
ncbi:hypothetical protein G6F42_022904 [Rhizopus arrhizus]|nr:hypothetical protein G6F42_022904 [Rhizopus arrhizus]